MRFPRNRRDFLKLTLASACSLPLARADLSFLHADESIAPPPPDHWASFRNSPANLGVSAAPLPNEMKLLWSHVTPDGTTSTAAIADGRVYMGALCGDVYCFELLTGKQIWKYRSVEVVEPNSFAPGFNAATTIDADQVYIGDDQGTFHAIDRTTGKRKWSYETEGEIVGGAQVRENRVIFGSHDGHLYCFNKNSGELIWRVDTHGPVNATPCLAGKYTFTTGCDQPILRVFDIEQGVQAAEVPLDSLLIASPAMYDDILYFGTGDGEVFALDWQNKKLRWEFSFPDRDQQIQSSPAVTEELVIIGSRDKNLYCLDRKSGEMRWRFQTRSKIDSSPVISGERVYFGSSDRNVYSVNLADGSLAWKQQAKQAVLSSPAIAEGCLVIGTDSANGLIMCFGAADKGE